MRHWARVTYESPYPIELKKCCHPERQEPWAQPRSAVVPPKPHASCTITGACHRLSGCLFLDMGINSGVPPPFRLFGPLSNSHRSMLHISNTAARCGPRRSTLLLIPSCCLPQRLVRSQEQLLHRNQQCQEPSIPRSHYWGKKKIQQRTLKQAAKMSSLDGKLHPIAACASWVFPAMLKHAITACSYWSIHFPPSAHSW